jgi:hypothetical protein
MSSQYRKGGNESRLSRLLGTVNFLLLHCQDTESLTHTVIAVQPEFLYGIYKQTNKQIRGFPVATTFHSRSIAVPCIWDIRVVLIDSLFCVVDTPAVVTPFELY